ncbi:2-amino-4-hydroxy-6-hydroxymethyldihydropteridine diphosphokinase [Peribacillus alkalitolerans]|uniref:2-amino-4-hydroxy-6- hydroxymethyldihydropteridine diphosphokinase n=1 Tax=Peribacillus alkalitolerans TaxID=1550385 RepID=UPI0013D11DB8|nr:2-amino-4-hydroxy-6-hydroxymethyldihydropteridine diphosphokinase [Peribacillus alkalitolerans]
MKSTAFLSLGTNIENRFQYLNEAVQLLREDKYILVTDISSIYETEPVGYTDQGNFLNIVVKIETDHSPEELLVSCQSIEESLGRKREIRWGPRTIDLDILLYNLDNIEADNLSIPHPRMHERAFVLIPLLEIESNIKLPTMDLPLTSLLENMPEKEGVRIWKQKNGEDAFVPFES